MFRGAHLFNGVSPAVRGLGMMPKEGKLAGRLHDLMATPLLQIKQALRTSLRGSWMDVEDKES
jgi:hypothetical protein